MLFTVSKTNKIPVDVAVGINLSFVFLWPETANFNSLKNILETDVLTKINRVEMDL